MEDPEKKERLEQEIKDLMMLIAAENAVQRPGDLRVNVDIAMIMVFGWAAVGFSWHSQAPVMPSYACLAIALGIGHGALREHGALKKKALARHDKLQQLQRDYLRACGREGAVAEWVVYDHTSEHPGTFTARKFAGGDPTEEVLTAHTLTELRRLIPAGWCRFPRRPEDGENVIEVWRDPAAR